VPRGKTFEERLVWALDQSGKTREEIAAAIGTRPQRLAEWASGRRGVSLEYLQELVRALEIDGHWLLLGEGEAKRATAPTEAQRILDEVRRLVSPPAVVDHRRETADVVRERSRKRKTG
jgi:transcriptional regulator with XRE-family HTH domain